jgi:hypothetical protein
MTIHSCWSLLHSHACSFTLVIIDGWWLVLLALAGRLLVILAHPHCFCLLLSARTDDSSFYHRHLNVNKDIPFWGKGNHCFYSWICNGGFHWLLLLSNILFKAAKGC